MQIFKVFVEEAMRFYGIHMAFDVFIREFSLVSFLWFGDLQEGSGFLWKEERTSASFNLGFSVYLR